jgi:hypothetical protein
MLFDNNFPSSADSGFFSKFEIETLKKLRKTYKQARKGVKQIYLQTSHFSYWIYF